MLQLLGCVMAAMPLFQGYDSCVPNRIVGVSGYSALSLDEGYLAGSYLTNPNRVFVYDRSQNPWQLRQTLVCPDTPGSFGTPISRTGNWLFVADPGHADHGAGSGAVFIFAGSSGSWTFSQELIPGYVATGDTFGTALAASGNRLLAGAPGDNDNGSEAGAVYAYALSGGVWTETQKIKPPDATPHSRFGATARVEGDVLIIGAPGDLPSGALYLYRATPNGWRMESKLELPGHTLGKNVSLSWPRVADSSGWPLIIEYSGGTWSVVQLDTPGLVYSIALDGDRVAIGSLYYTEDGGGATVVYERFAGIWRLRNVRIAPNPRSEDEFGGFVSLEGNALLVGAPAYSPNAGVYVYNSTAPSEVQSFCWCSSPHVPPCDNGIGDHQGCRNYTTQGSRLSACGSTSVVGDSLILTCTTLPPNQATVFFMGGGAIPHEPLGDGLLCIGGGGKGVYRFPLKSSSSSGEVTLGPGIVAFTNGHFGGAGHILAGATWYFQCWYRDPWGPCNTHFNISNGMAATFVP